MEYVEGSADVLELAAKLPGSQQALALAYQRLVNKRCAVRHPMHWSSVVRLSLPPIQPLANSPFAGAGPGRSTSRPARRALRRRCAARARLAVVVLLADREHRA